MYFLYLQPTQVNVETLRRANDKLLGAEEANRKTISDQAEDQVCDDITAYITVIISTQAWI